MLQERDVTVFYVIDPPALLLDSIILTCTLRTHFPDVEVIAYCPDVKHDLVPEYLLEFYRHMNVDIRYMPAGEFEPYYKQGNKIVAACQPRTTKHSIFFDTDIAIARSFDLNRMAKDGLVSVVPEGRFTWGKDPSWWSNLYAKFDMPVPEERVLLSRTGVASPPYFNAGVISFPTHSSFSSEWMKVALAIDHFDDIHQRRPWQDQIALPVAIQRSGLKADVLDVTFNLSLTRNVNKPQQVEQEIQKANELDGLILHYHQPHYLDGTRYAEGVDEAMRHFTSWKSVNAMMRQPREQGERAGQVFHQFHVLKNTNPRTAEEEKLFQQFRAEKNAIKAARHDMQRWLEEQPMSILN